jgi:hypothetical protein
VRLQTTVRWKIESIFRKNLTINFRIQSHKRKLG